MSKKDISIIGIIAAITAISVTLPGLLYQRGLPLGWALALLAGFITVAVLGYMLGQRIDRD